MRTIHVIASRNNHGQSETLLVGLHQHLCRRLTRSVRIGGRKDTGLQKVITLLTNLAIHLIRRDVNEATHADLLRALEQDMRSVDIRVGEAVRITEAQVDVGLGCEVHDGVDVVSFHAVEYVGRNGDVAPVEGEVRLPIETGGVVESGAVVELVKGDDVVRGVCEDEMADEPACSTGECQCE